MNQEVVYRELQLGNGNENSARFQGPKIKLKTR
jgi:hypothetical protein